MSRLTQTIKSWLIAIRPFAYTASLSSVFLGLALAYATGVTLHGGLFALTLLGVLCLHTAANLFNDVFDFERGLDHVVYPTSGALVRGMLSPRQVLQGAWVFLGLGVASWCYLAYFTGFPAICVGVLGALLALSYTGRKFGLKYKKLGDVVILLAFGPIPVIGAFWIQTQIWSWLPVLWFWPIALLTVGILHANNWRDLEHDIAQNCFTLASTLGPKKSGQYYRVLILLPYLLVPLFFCLGLLGYPQLHVQPSVFLIYFSLPQALKLLRIREQSPFFNALDAETAKLQFAFSLMLILGLVISRHWHFQ